MELIKVNGVALEVRWLPLAFAGSRAPIVFLHEGLGSVAAWRDWPRQLCDLTGRPGIVYSRRGYGLSDLIPDVRGAGRLAPDYMHLEAFEVLPALLRQLGISEPVLLGHSDGASIALLHASRHRVAACVAMAPHVIVEDLSIRSIEQARIAFGQGLRERLQPFHANVDVAFWQWNDIWLSQDFRGFDIREDCRHITAPVLAMLGEDDAYGSMRQIDEIAPTSGPLTLERLTRCGHSPHRDQPARTSASIARFLQKLP